jgi:hypothetical protein
MQKQEIGARLIRAGLDRLRSQGAAGCILLGNPAYYSRFGFCVAAQYAPARGSFGILPDAVVGGPVPDGRFGYHAAFAAIASAHSPRFTNATGTANALRIMIRSIKPISTKTTRASGAVLVALIG